MTKMVLQNVRVVDFSWQGVGPLTVRYLAHHGAEVVRIESGTRPDMVRAVHPMKEGLDPNGGGYFANFNSGKYGMTLNLKHPKGLAIAKRLVARADIVADNFTGGVMQKLGLGYDQLTRVKPDIIAISMPLMGQTGPKREYRAHGPQLAPLAGLGTLIGWPDRKPCGSPSAYTDWFVPHFAAVAVLAALAYRHRTGKGQYIDFAQREAAIYSLGEAILDHTANQRSLSRMGNRSPYAAAAPHGAYRCQGDDRWCVIAVFDDAQWQRFCAVLGNPLWTKEERFATILGRVEHAEALDQLVEQWTVNYAAEDVMAMLQGVGIAAGVVKNGKDLVEDPQLTHRGLFRVLEHPVMGNCIYDGPSFILSKTPGEVTRPGPCLGEHNHFVCTDLLAMTDEEFTQLAADGVFD